LFFVKTNKCDYAYSFLQKCIIYIEEIAYYTRPVNCPQLLSSVHQKSLQLSPVKADSWRLFVYLWNILMVLTKCGIMRIFFFHSWKKISLKNSCFFYY